jgi:hypothetical protein
VKPSILYYYGQLRNKNAAWIIGFKESAIVLSGQKYACGSEKKEVGA